MNKRSYLKKLTWVFLLLSASGISAAQESGEPILKLNLQKALEIALSDNPTIKIADKDIERKNYARKEVIAGLFPQIDFSGQYTRNVKKQVMYIDGSDGFPGMGGTGGSGDTDTSTPTADPNKGFSFGRNNQWSTGFSFQLPIIAPSLWANIKMTRFDLEKTVELARSSRLGMVNQVQKAYYNLLMAEDSYEVLKLSYDNAKLNADNFKNKFKQGMASEYDVLRAEVQVRNQEPGLLQAENGVNLAKLQIKVLLGLDMNIEIEAENTLADYESQMYTDALNIDTSLRNNTSLKQLELDTRLLQQSTKASKLAFAPTLAATGLYNWMSMNNDFRFNNYRWDPFSTVGLALSIPIFQGGARYFRMKQAEISVINMGFQRENLEKNLTMQVRMSMDNIQKSIKQIASNKEGVKQAEKAVSIMQKSFKIGSASFIDLNDADLALTSSQLSYYQAIFDYLTAKSELELVLGNTNLNEYKTQNDSTRTNN